MTDLLDSLKEAIRASLPEATAGELQEFIKQAQFDKSELNRVSEKLEAQRISLDTLLKTNSSLSNELVDHESIEAKNSKLEERERNVLKREESIEVLLLRKELELCKDSKFDMLRLTEKVFGHPEVTVSNSVTKEFLCEPTYSGGPNTTIPTTEFITTKTTASKT